MADQEYDPTRPFQSYANHNPLLPNHHHHLSSLPPPPPNPFSQHPPTAFPPPPSTNNNNTGFSKPPLGFPPPGFPPFDPSTWKNLMAPPGGLPGPYPFPSPYPYPAPNGALAPPRPPPPPPPPPPPAPPVPASTSFNSRTAIAPISSSRLPSPMTGGVPPGPSPASGPHIFNPPVPPPSLAPPAPTLQPLQAKQNPTPKQNKRSARNTKKNRGGDLQANLKKALYQDEKYTLHEPVWKVVAGQMTRLHFVETSPSNLPITKYIATSKKDAVAIHQRILERSNAATYYSDGSFKHGWAWGAAVEWVKDTSAASEGGKVGKILREELGMCDPTDAEMGGMRKALEAFSSVGKLKEDELIIFSDSQAAITLIDSGIRYQSQLFTSTLERTLTLHPTVKVTLVWVPGHVGIVGNELADRTAVSGSTTTFLARRAGRLPGVPDEQGDMPVILARRMPKGEGVQDGIDEEGEEKAEDGNGVDVGDVDDGKKQLEHEQPTDDSLIAGIGSLFVARFPEDATANDLEVLFGQFGQLSSIDIFSIPPMTERFAMLSFVDPSVVDEAIKWLDDKPVTLPTRYAATRDCEVWKGWQGSLKVALNEVGTLVPTSVAASFPELPDWAKTKASPGDGSDDKGAGEDQDSKNPASGDESRLEDELTDESAEEVIPHSGHGEKRHDEPQLNGSGVGTDRAEEDSLMVGIEESADKSDQASDAKFASTTVPASTSESESIPPTVVDPTHISTSTPVPASPLELNNYRESGGEPRGFVESGGSAQENLPAEVAQIDPEDLSRTPSHPSPQIQPSPAACLLTPSSASSSLLPRQEQQPSPHRQPSLSAQPEDEQYNPYRPGQSAFVPAPYTTPPFIPPPGGSFYPFPRPPPPPPSISLPTQPPLPLPTAARTSIGTGVGVGALQPPGLPPKSGYQPAGGPGADVNQPRNWNRGPPGSFNYSIPPVAGPPPPPPILPVGSKVRPTMNPPPGRPDQVPSGQKRFEDMTPSERFLMSYEQFPPGPGNKVSSTGKAKKAGGKAALAGAGAPYPPSGTGKRPAFSPVSSSPQVLPSLPTLTSIGGPLGTRSTSDSGPGPNSGLPPLPVGGGGAQGVDDSPLPTNVADMSRLILDLTAENAHLDAQHARLTIVTKDPADWSLALAHLAKSILSEQEVLEDIRRARAKEEDQVIDWENVLQRNNVGIEERRSFVLDVLDVLDASVLNDTQIIFNLRRQIETKTGQLTHRMSQLPSTTASILQSCEHILATLHRALEEQKNALDEAARRSSVLGGLVQIRRDAAGMWRGRKEEIDLVVRQLTGDQQPSPPSLPPPQQQLSLLPSAPPMVQTSIQQQMQPMQPMHIQQHLHPYLHSHQPLPLPPPPPPPSSRTRMPMAMNNYRRIMLCPCFENIQMTTEPRTMAMQDGRVYRSKHVERSIHRCYQAMSSEPSPPTKALKRGSACQTCRKRKLGLLSLTRDFQRRLSSTGEKPTCKTCLKNAQECIYDEVVQPKTRIRKLEDKISRLESILAQSGSDRVGPARSAPATERKRSTGTFPYPAINHAISESFPEGSPPERRAKRDGQEAFSQAFEELWGMSTTASRLDDFEFFGDQQPAFPAYPMIPSGLPEETVEPETSDHVLGVLNKLIEESNPVGSVPVDPWEFDLALMNDGGALKSPTQPLPMELDLFASLRINQDIYHPDQSSMSFFQTDMPPATMLPTPEASSASSISSSSVPMETRSAALRAYVLDREELPREIRDMVLRSFFDRRNSFGIVLDVERFWSKLESPVEEDQPHPAFLFAMYLCGSQFSPDKAVRALDDMFFDMAKKNLDEGVANSDKRVIDLIRAATALSASSYSKARFRTAWVFGGTAMRLSALANLQLINFPFNSLSFKHPKPNTRNPSRKRWRDAHQSVRPPKDSIEFGEYIWAFWMAFSLDRCGSTATGFASAMSWSEIETPFPLPLSQYADLDAVNSQPKTAMYEVLDESRQILDGDLSGSFQLIALFILSEASRLQEEFVQPSLKDNYLASHVSSPAESFGSSAEIFESPGSIMAYAESPSRWGPALGLEGPIPNDITKMQNALSKFVRSLPAECTNPGRKVLGGVPPWRMDPMLVDSSFEDLAKLSDEVWGIEPQIVLLHTQIHAAFALIYQERSDYDPNAWAQAVKSSRSVVKILHIVAEIDFSRLGFFILVCWRIVAHVLLEEVKRLRTVGDEEEALHITIDIDLIVLAMKRIGEVYAIGNELVICQT
ncbi:Zn(2)-C6 fungal-type DNA-binding domain [Phaffia rhodozyma]|uniref:Zn(2)-C6 fungal-type DNA-binding domain n=1 Tax=Phaffia rhodozyma TaxID=264483 RepID=A0A0F7SNE2_PHARH|nr:Zn(2)-C6 fungal-type DNA-binding domain [Phaffia rhodozyma]